MEARTRTTPPLDVVTLSTGTLVRKIPAHLVRALHPWLASSLHGGPATQPGRAAMGGRGMSRASAGKLSLLLGLCL
jgi:hypothetical protein